MIATVTLNPALDKTMAIRGFAIGATNRASIEQIDAGGKGINVAKAARQLGCPAIALGFLAGSNGRWIADALQAMGIPCDFEWVPGETRVNLKIKDPLTGTETEINEPGFQVGADHVQSLKRKIDEQAGQCSVMVFSGSLPPGVPPEIYAEFIRIARNRGAQTILDTAGAALKYGIAAGPDLIKPNRAEAEEVLETRIDGVAALVGAARRLLELGARVVVLSLGADGALAVSPRERWRAWSPSVTAASGIGAGDAMVAALAVAMTRGLALADALRLATAAGAATAATNGSATELGSIQGYAKRVVLQPIGETAGAC
ncbi:MAG: 1-phosphofructokinase [Bryobacteraceae bacterium]